VFRREAFYREFIGQKLSPFSIVKPNPSFYSQHSQKKRNLIAEGLPARRIYLTGSPMPEVLSHNMEKISSSKALRKLQLEKGRFFLVSLHREENVDSSESLLKLLEALELLESEFGCPVIVSTHPRTRKRLESLRKQTNDNIRFLKPFGFFDYVNLQMKAKCVISDSGTISEEASILNFPAVTARNSMERPEAMDCGRIILAGLEPQTILSAVKLQISRESLDAKSQIPDEYRVEDVSLRVLKLILGTAKLSNMWDGIKSNDLS